MANPTYPADGASTKIDALTDASNDTHLKLAIGAVTAGGAANPPAWAGSATHAEGAPLYSGDGVMLIAGVDPSGNANPVKTDAAGDLLVSVVPPSTCVRTSPAASASDTLILAANANRVGATVTNDSSAVLYLAFGTTAASLSDYTVTLAGSGAAPFAYYEVPFGWVGEIRGIWASATGHARVSEMS
jgi:hypothetical protein